MRFYLDADLSWRIARIARRPGVDIVSANEVELRTATDLAQIEYAAQDGRCIVTNNRNDFIALDRLYQERGVEHAGILITAESLPTHDFYAVARALAYYSSLHTEPFIPWLVDYLHPAPADWVPTDRQPD